REIKITDWNRAWYEYTGNCVICMGYTEMDNYAGENEPELFLTWGLPILNKYPGCENVKVIEPNKVYGDFASGHGFVFNMEDYRIHEAAFVSQITIGNLLKYGQISVDEVPNFIDSTDQVWMYKDYIGLFACLAFAFCLFNLAVLLAEYVPALSKAKRPVGRNVGARGIEMVIVIIIGILGPLVAMKTDAFGIVGGPSGAGLTKLGFHLKYSNLGFGVIIGCGIFAIAGFILFMVAMAKKGDKLSLSDLGLAPADYDITASFGTKLKAVLSQFAPSLLIALIVIVSGFTYMKVMLDVCGTDFYCWFFGIKNIPLAKLPAMIPYIVVFMLLHIIIGVDINVIRRYPTTGNETLDTVIAVVLNMLIAAGMVIIVVAVKWHLQSSDQWAVDSNFIWKMGMDTQRIWGMRLGMGIASGGTVGSYKQIGWMGVGACLVGLLGGIMCALYGQYQFDFNAFPSWV
ncbi:MAG: hypothetical protein MJ150_02550, partial [Clostridia bacterium]|nr:hypothetical protein [Clostridia bacterium]